MKISSVWLISYLFLFWSCRDTDTRGKDFSKLIDGEFAPVTVEGDVVLDTAFLRYPSRILAQNGFLIIFDQRREQNLSIMNTNTGEMNFFHIPYGSEDGELFDVCDIFRTTHSNTFGLYDITLAKIIEITFDSLGRVIPDRVIEKPFRDERLSNVLSIVQLSDTEYAGTLLDDIGRIVIFSPKEIIRSFGSLPLNIYGNSNYVFGHSFRADIAKSGDTLFCATFFADIFEVYDLKTSTALKKLHGPEAFWPIYNTKNNRNLELTDATKVAFLSIDCSAVSAYAIYHGSNKRNVIYSFDKTGNPKTKYIINQANVEVITVDDVTKKVFLLSDVDLNPKLISFSI